MTDTARLEASVHGHEGEKAIPYKDSKGLWTFADGRCLETKPLTAAEWKRLLDMSWLKVQIAPAGSEGLRGEDLTEVVDELDKLVPCWNLLNDARQNALTEMAYQLGVPHFLGFHEMLSAFPAAVKTGDGSIVEAEAIDSNWFRELDALKSDRAKVEIKQLCTGQFAPGRYAALNFESQPVAAFAPRTAARTTLQNALSPALAADFSPWTARGGFQCLIPFQRSRQVCCHPPPQLLVSRSALPSAS